MTGQEPLAVFQGPEESPGARLLAPGDAIGDFVVATIAPDSVVLQHPDTSYVFRLESPSTGNEDRP